MSVITSLGCSLGDHDWAAAHGDFSICKAERFSRAIHSHYLDIRTVREDEKLVRFFISNGDSERCFVTKSLPVWELETHRPFLSAVLLPRGKSLRIRMLAPDRRIN